MIRSVTLGVVVLLAPLVAGAQEHARIAGRVVYKSTKAGIPGAEVRLLPPSAPLVTDSGGFFRFDRVLPGDVTLIVRRVGFAPESAFFEVHPREDLDVLVELRESVQQLDTVNVAGRADPLATGKLKGFYERKHFGIGALIDAGDLKGEVHQQLGDVITSRVPGTRLVRGRLGPSSWIATRRDSGIRPAGARLDQIDRQLGADPTACYPDVYVDGVNVYQFGFGRRLFDISSINTFDVAAIEVYVGAARIPIQYNKSSSACGVLLIWTK